MKHRYAPNISSGLRKENLSIEVTSRCNCACLHCFARGRNGEEASLPLDLVMDIMVEGYDNDYRHLHITGGEPLLWDGLFDTVSYARRVGYEAIFLNTNGILLSESVCSRLAGCEGLSISVSLDGPEAWHDFLRGKGSYRKASKGIQRAIEAGISLYIFTIVQRGLLSGLPHFVENLYGHYPEIKCLTLIPLIRTTDGTFPLAKELLDPEDFIALVQDVGLLNLYGYRIDVLNEPLANATAKALGMPWLPRSFPLYRYGSMIVLADRDMSLSHSTRETFGKYEPGMIGEVLCSKEYKAAIDRGKTACSFCRFSEICLESDIVRPSECDPKLGVQDPYCVKVLSLLGV